MPKILVFPIGKNPYQNLLYSHIDKTNCEIEYLDEQTNSRTLNFLLFYPSLLYYRVKGFNILHLHWLDFSFPINLPGIYLLSFINSITSLIWIKLLGYKLIWTVHNVLPHNKQTSNDSFVTKTAVSLSNHVIVHSNQTVTELKELEITLKKYSIIPIGTYDTYQNVVSKTEARKKLGIKSSEFVFLFIGNIRKNRGIDNLVITFNKLNKIEKNIKLIIVGKCENKELKKVILDYKELLGKDLLFIDHYVEDDDIQYYMNASDCTVFPFTTVTTSSSVILSFSFRKPVIAPRLGNIVEIPDDLGYFYDSTDNNGLLKEMKKSIKNTKNYSFMKSIEPFLKSISWDNIATQTLKLYQKI